MQQLENQQTRPVCINRNLYDNVLPSHADNFLFVYIDFISSIIKDIYFGVFKFYVSVERLSPFVGSYIIHFSFLFKPIEKANDSICGNKINRNESQRYGSRRFRYCFTATYGRRICSKIIGDTLHRLRKSSVEGITVPKTLLLQLFGGGGCPMSSPEICAKYSHLLNFGRSHA